MERAGEGLRIVHVTGLRPSKYGSIEHLFVRLARQAGQRGHHLHLVWEAEPSVPRFLEDLSRAGATTEVIPTTGRHRPLALARLVRLYREQRADLVHAHFSPSDLTGLIAARLAGRPTYWTIHHLLASEVPGERVRRRSLATARARLALSQRVEAVSYAARAAYLDLGLPAERVEVNRLGIPARQPTTSRDAMRR